MNIILASTSKRRFQLLKILDFPFQVKSVNVDEKTFSNESPVDYITRMVQQKTSAFIQTNKIVNVTLVLTADTIGVMPDRETILTKPENKKNAFSMWKEMSGKSHQVWTSVQATLINESQIIWQDTITEKTEVKFVSLTEEDMESYWETGEPKDKAGGYGIQGKAASWVESIHGSYTNVVGLPLSQTKILIETAKFYI